MSDIVGEHGAAAARRIVYPRLPAALVASVNAVSAAGLGGPAGSERPSWHARPSTSSGGYVRAVAVAVRIGGSLQRVYLDAAAVEAALGDLVVADFEALDGDLQAAVLETTLERPLAEIGERLGAEVVLDSVRVYAVDDGNAQCPPNAFLFEVHTAGAGVLCSVLLELTSPLPASVMDALEQFARPLDCGDLPVRLAFEVGSTELAQTEARLLAPGDIVLLDPCDAAEDRVRITVANRVWRLAELREAGVTLAGSAS